MAAPKSDLAASYGEALLDLGRANPAVVVIDTDIADSCQTEAFKKAFPDRSFDVGIAEQNLVTFGAGLALAGKVPFCNSFAVFAAERGLDMIRQSACYNNAPLKIVGHSAGQTMGYTGPSHHTLEDVAALRAIPRIAVVSPCDAEETRQMVATVANWPGPVYLRLPRATVRAIHDNHYEFKMGQVDRVADGTDVTLFAYGVTVEIALAARDLLSNQGIQARVVNVPCIKPLPDEALILEGEDTAGAVVVEDHNIFGGLGGLVS